jgi:hypothetical protein
MAEVEPFALPHRWSVGDGDVRRPTRSDSYRLAWALAVVLAVVALDVKNFLILGAGDTGGSQGERYLFLIVPVAAAVLIRLGTPSTLVRNPSATDLPLVLLVLFALPGTLAARLSSGASSTILALVAAGIVALLYLLTVQDLSEREARRLAKLITTISMAYAVLGAIGYSGLATWLVELRGFRNSKLFFLGMAIAGVVALRWRAAAVLLVPVTAIVFRVYPSATLVLAAMVTVLILYLTRPGGGNLRVIAVSIVCLLAFLVAMLNTDRTVSVASNYFASVGKINNNVVRLGLWKAGLEKFAHSPLYGDAFYGPTTVLVWISNPPYPPYRWPGPLHNDYLLLASSGGVIAIGLFLTWAIGTNVAVFRRYQVLAEAGRVERVRLVRILLVGFNTWLCAALFNPLLQEVGTATALMAIYGILMIASSVPASEQVVDPTSNAADLGEQASLP